MKSVSRAAVLAASIVVAAIFTLPAWADTPEEVAQRYSESYDVVSVTVSATDPAVYEMVVENPDGTTRIILVEVATGDIVGAEEPGPGPGPVEEAAVDPATRDECRQYGWVDFGFRNQGQCVRFVNTGFDSRSVAPDDEDEASADEEDASDDEDDRPGEECRSGGWEAMGFRNQGQCIRAAE